MWARTVAPGALRLTRRRAWTGRTCISAVPAWAQSTATTVRTLSPCAACRNKRRGPTSTPLRVTAPAIPAACSMWARSVTPGAVRLTRRRAGTGRTCTSTVPTCSPRPATAVRTVSPFAACRNKRGDNPTSGFRAEDSGGLTYVGTDGYTWRVRPAQRRTYTGRS